MYVYSVQCARVAARGRCRTSPPVLLRLSSSPPPRSGTPRRVGVKATGSALRSSSLGIFAYLPTFFLEESAFYSTGTEPASSSSFGDIFYIYILSCFKEQRSGRKEQMMSGLLFT